MSESRIAIEPLDVNELSHQIETEKTSELLDLIETHDVSESVTGMET